jgi:hemin uptake protein HemP
MRAADGADHGATASHDTSDTRPGARAAGPASAPSAPRDDAATASPRRAVASADLFQGLRELVILHRNDEYRLRITRAGKLILTK